MCRNTYVYYICMWMYLDIHIYIFQRRRQYDVATPAARVESYTDYLSNVYRCKYICIDVYRCIWSMAYVYKCIYSICRDMYIDVYRCIWSM